MEYIDSKNGKSYWVDDVYYCYNCWDYIKIKFNKWDKNQLFNKDWWKAIKFNWIDEFCSSYGYWEYIKIKFNEWDEWQLFYYKDIEEEQNKSVYIYKNNKIYKQELVEMNIQEIYNLIK